MRHCGYWLRILSLSAVLMCTYGSVAWAAMVTVTGQGSSDRAAVKAALRQAIDATGYRVLEVSSEPCVKKGLF